MAVVTDALVQLIAKQVDSFAATIGPALIKSLLTSAVHLHVASGLSPGLGEGLLERRLDMIVTTDPPEDVTALERHPQIVLDDHLAAPVAHRLAIEPC